MATIISRDGLKKLEQTREELRLKLSRLRMERGQVSTYKGGESLSDNNEMLHLEDDEIGIQKQLLKISAEILSAQVVDEEINPNVVGYGATVLIQLTKNGLKQPPKKILFSDSAEHTELQKVSANAPIGRAIYQKGVGTIESYSVNKNQFSVEILEISY